jgi:hypothetical protein
MRRLIGKSIAEFGAKLPSRRRSVMPIEFACRCGKKHRAAEEHAGKHAKCDQCGQVVAIPAPKMAAQAASPAALTSRLSTPKTIASAPVQSDGRRCPSCRSPLSPVAVLCINCGYNLNTGKKVVAAPTIDTIETEPEKKRPPSRLRQILVSRLTSWKLWSGLGMMLAGGAALYFGMHMDGFSSRVYRRLGFAVVLFMAGGFTFINGLCDGDNADDDGF